jgi:nucleotide-binding universal stress UspA family protein
LLAKWEYGALWLTPAQRATSRNEKSQRCVFVSKETAALTSARRKARDGQPCAQRLSSGGQDVGHLLLSQAVAFRADLLVMGAYGHSTLREWLFGGVTRTVLYQAGLPVLMSR